MGCPPSCPFAFYFNNDKKGLSPRPLAFRNEEGPSPSAFFHHFHNFYQSTRKVNDMQPLQRSVDNDVGGLEIRMSNSMSMEESKPFHNLAEEIVSLHGL
jgi:hypothetical protein